MKVSCEYPETRPPLRCPDGDPVFVPAAASYHSTNSERILPEITNSFAWNVIREARRKADTGCTTIDGMTTETLVKQPY